MQFHFAASDDSSFAPPQPSIHLNSIQITCRKRWTITSPIVPEPTNHTLSHFLSLYLQLNGRIEYFLIENKYTSFNDFSSVYLIKMKHFGVYTIPSWRNDEVKEKQRRRKNI